MSLRAIVIVIHREVDALRDRECRRVALRVIEKAPDLAHLLYEVSRRRRPRSNPSVSMTHRAFQRDRLTSAEPQRRMWFLERLGLHRNVFEAPKLAGKRRSRLCPQCLHDLQAFHELARATFAGDAEDLFGHVWAADS